MKGCWKIKYVVDTIDKPGYVVPLFFSDCPSEGEWEKAKAMARMKVDGMRVLSLDIMFVWSFLPYELSQL